MQLHSPASHKHLQQQQLRGSCIKQMPHRWQQQLGAAPGQQVAAQRDPQQQDQQQQQQRRRRTSPRLLEQRQALAAQQEQPTRQQSSSEQDGWFVEQPVGTWSQQPPQPWPQQQQQQWAQSFDRQQSQEEQELLDQMQQWMELVSGPDDLQVQPMRLVSNRYGPAAQHHRAEAWFHERRYLRPSALHAEIMARSGRGELEVAALTYLVRTASCAQDAALTLSAISAVRQVAVSQGRVQPWPDSFLKAFTQMTTICDAHEILVSAMQRPNELGLVFKHKSLNIALKHWGSKLELHKLEQIMLVADTAGLPPDARMAYALVRACVNARQWDKLDEVLEWFRVQGVAQFKPAMQKLLDKAAAERAGGVGDSSGL